MLKGYRRTWSRGRRVKGVRFLFFISAGRSSDCEAAKCLKGGLPVQYFILMGSIGVRGVSGEEQWEKSGENIRTRWKTRCRQERRAKEAEGEREGAEKKGSRLEKNGERNRNGGEKQERMSANKKGCLQSSRRMSSCDIKTKRGMQWKQAKCNVRPSSLWNSTFFFTFLYLLSLILQFYSLITIFKNLFFLNFTLFIAPTYSVWTPDPQLFSQKHKTLTCFSWTRELIQSAAPPHKRKKQINKFYHQVETDFSSEFERSNGNSVKTNRTWKKHLKTKGRFKDLVFEFHSKQKKNRLNFLSSQVLDDEISGFNQSFSYLHTCLTPVKHLHVAIILMFLTHFSEQSAH